MCALRSFFATSGLVLFASSIFFAPSECAPNYVKSLTPKNFDEHVDGSKGVLVEFYAPWCGHCQQLEPEFQEVARNYRQSKDVIIAKVDADEYRSLGDRFGVAGFPTIKWFAKGTTKDPKDYSGARAAMHIINFVDTELALDGGTNAVVELTDRNFDRVVDGTKHVLVEFYAPWCGHCQSLAPQYEKLARAYRKHKDTIVIAAVDADLHRDVGMRFGVSGYPTIKLFLAQNPKNPQTYSGYRNAAALTEYLEGEVGIKPGKATESAGKAANTPKDDEDAEEEVAEEEDDEEADKENKFDYDGIISSHFKEVDLDADGFLSRSEAKEMYGMLDESETKIPNLVSNMFEEMDMNADKKISLYEFKTGGF